MSSCQDSSFWRFIYTGKQDCYSNMALDEAILLSVKSGASPTTVRVYRWEEASVSVGYRQKILADYSSPVPLVRRPTGGRAVFHDDEYTVSVIGRNDSFKDFGNMLATYMAISSSILAGLALFGVEGSLVPKDRPAIKSKKTPICFDISSVYEILCFGKKIVGSAQRRLKDAFLQQSSIPLFIDTQKFPPMSDIFKDGERFSLASSNIAFLRQFISTFPEEESIVLAFKKGFESELGVKFEEGGLTTAELETAESLKHEKYLTNEWNHQMTVAGKKLFKFSIGDIT